MKLFAVYIGGDFPGANVELHDMRFVAAPSLKQTYDELRRQWWGVPSSLHIDCWAEISGANGYEVSLRPVPFAGPEKLFFVNLGGYETNGTTELHRNVFVVAETEAKAKVRALREAKEWIEPHRDEIYEAEKSFCLAEPLGTERLYVHLIANADAKPPLFTCNYIPIREQAAD